MFKIGDKVILTEWSEEHGLVGIDLDNPFELGKVYTIINMREYEYRHDGVEKIYCVYMEGIANWYVPSNVLRLAEIDYDSIDKAIDLVNKKIEEVVCLKLETK